MDQPAPGFGFTHKAFSGTPVGNLPWAALNGAGCRRPRVRNQSMDIQPLSHSICRIPFPGFVSRHHDSANPDTQACEFGGHRIGVLGTSIIVIRPNCYRLALQRCPVGFVDGRGGPTHSRSGNDANGRQCIGTFLTLHQHHGVRRSHFGQAVEWSGFRHAHGPRPNVPRAVLLALGGFVAVDAGQQLAVSAEVIPFARRGAQFIDRRSRFGLLGGG